MGIYLQLLLLNWGWYWASGHSNHYFTDMEQQNALPFAYLPSGEIERRPWPEPFEQDRGQTAGEGETEQSPPNSAEEDFVAFLEEVKIEPLLHYIRLITYHVIYIYIYRYIQHNQV